MDPNLDAPKTTRDAILKWGGTNPFNKPRWRVCLAQSCTVRRAGAFHSLPTGELSIFGIGANGKVEYEPIKGDRCTSGIMEVPKYPCDGWILEVWLAAEIWGSREEWASHKSEDGSRIMGEYPSQGDYWMIAGPFDKIPELSDLENAIAMYDHSMRNRPTNLNNHLRQVMKDEEARQEARRLKLERDLAYMRQNELVPVLKSGSLEAQRFRNELQTMVGDPSHLGAVHDA